MISRITRSLLVSLAFVATAVAGQDFRATITGLVRDPDAAAIPGATVKAVNVGNGEVKEAKTTSDGHYTIPYLNPGTYNVEVSAAGFQTLKRENIVLRVTDKLDLPLRMTIGNVAETVTVAGQEVIETGSADRGLVFDPIKVQELPHRRMISQHCSPPPAAVCSPGALTTSGIWRRA